MKNLFKNLMLVAVAAMAFTACTESNNEVNAVTKKVVLEFVADLADDDTRVAFGEQDGNKYPVVWEADDDVIVKVGENLAWYTLTDEDVLESGKKAIIRPEFELMEDETLSGDIVATVNGYPYLAEQDGNKPTISLKAEAEYPATNLVFEHQFAYGKMELVGLPTEFNITEVKLNLVGGDKELNYTIRGNSVEDNIFWFTTEAMEAVESFAVYASNGAVTYYKEVTVEKNFAFEVGKVSAFRVKDLVVKPADYKFEFASAQYIDGLLTLKGTDASDCLNIIVNPGLETLAAGNYVPNTDYDYSTSYPYSPFWTSDDALEFDPTYSNYDLSILPDNHYFSSINLSVALEGDVYTIVVTGEVYVDGNTKTVEFTYNGPVSEPTVPAFTSAIWNNPESPKDKLVTFRGDFGELYLNFYNCNTESFIDLGVYTIEYNGNGPNKIYGGYDTQYGYFKDAEGNVTYIISGTVNFVSCENGQYHVEFENIDNGDDDPELLEATFTGEIENLQVPDMREKLAKPTNVQVSVSGKTITTTWEAVEGADGYLFELYSPYDEKFTEIVEGTSYSFTALNSLYYYYFKLTAYASDENSKYRNSDEIYLEARTEDTDPKMEISESALSFTADGGEKTFTVTLKNTDAAIEYTQEGDWFSVELSGDTFTVSASANESETDAREGSITVTAGELSQTIDVTQSKKAAASTGGADGKTLETAYKFTTYTKKTDMGYPVMCLSGSEDNAVFEFESNGSASYPQGLLTFNCGSWYTGWIVYHVDGEIVHDTVGNTQASNIDLAKSYTYLTKSGNEYTVEYIMIVLNSGETIWYTFDGTFTF